MRRGAKAVLLWVRSAPLTYLWLLVLLANTVFLNHLPEQVQERFLGKRSTNLHHLSEDPFRVLISSAFWLEGGGWPLYFVLFTIFHATAERWLGTIRWLGVVVLAHVGATYVSEGVLYEGIRHGYVNQAAVNTLDVGVSYALAGVMGVLAYRIVTPWRYVYLAALALVYGVPLIVSTDFTAVGHVSAVLIGLCCHRLTRSRAAPWDPVESTVWQRFAPAG
ncbi:rhomboid-like protein [Rhodococcus sp. 27YEA15]|uniref:rhomboid-like protein n=1 Tax=Rhodococcus sp. 27YEA15 TaxID=3156259 RepID=UPI003C7AC9F2